MTRSQSLSSMSGIDLGMGTAENIRSSIWQSSSNTVLRQKTCNGASKSSGHRFDMNGGSSIALSLGESPSVYSLRAETGNGEVS